MQEYTENKERVEFWNKKPFPYAMVKNNYIRLVCSDVQNEILQMPMSCFDRYDNNFEKKFTFRDKENLPQETKKLFDYLQTDEFIQYLEKVTGFRVENDEYKHYWGIHIFNDGDKLDVHIDAGIHPKNGKKKFLTFGLYLSKDYKTEYEGQLELWSGDVVEADRISFIDNKVISIPCFAGTSLIFACSDNAWHGAPTTYIGDERHPRIFLTISYLINHNQDCVIEQLNKIDTQFGVKFKNTKTRAYFPASRHQIDTDEISNLRLLRATEQATELYRYKK